MKNLRVVCLWSLLSLALLCAGVAAAAEMSREQALQALGQPDTGTRLAAVNRLAEIGQMSDADRLLGRLGDADPDVRDAAAQAMWRIWSRSGDPAIDQLFARGVEQMQGGEHERALTVFDDIVARKPDFAEGWNKRATLYFLLGRNRESLKDCDEVLKRNPNHFGALSGAGQIHLQLGNPQLALEFFRRALKVNPNLDSLRQVIPLLEHHLRDKGRSTT
ncbi:MAG TPA: tetratricopeptide repeat protein [Burkholderiaceae bacterium]